MSDRELVTIEAQQFVEILRTLTAFSNALWDINDQLKPLDNAIDKQTLEITKWQSIQNESIVAGFALVAEAIAKVNPLPPPQPKSLEVFMSFVVKDDHEPVNFGVVLGDVTDAEGNTIPDAALDLSVESSDPNVVAVSFDAASKSGSISFGNPGNATLTANVSSGGKLLGSGVAGFVVTVGDPAAISSVALNFDGITEAPPA